MEQSARYVYKVFQEKSITKAAEKLFISQPALSAAIGRHEKELGFQIFNRATLPLSLTPKGQIYIESLSQILAIEEEAKRRIHGTTDQESQQIAIGCSNSTAYYLIPYICTEFNRMHPEIKITMDLGNNGGMDNLTQKLLQKNIDFYISDSKPNIKCKATQLLQEPILIAISNTIKIPNVLKEFATTHENLLTDAYKKPVTDYSLFADVPFVSYFAGTSMFKKMQKILGDYQTTAIHITNAKNAIFHYQLAKQGIGAMFMAVSAAKELFTPEDDMSYFFLDHELAKHEIYICSNTDGIYNPIMQDFLHTCQNVCQKYA